MLDDTKTIRLLEQSIDVSTLLNLIDEGQSRISAPSLCALIYIRENGPATAAQISKDLDLCPRAMATTLGNLHVCKKPMLGVFKREPKSKGKQPTTWYELTSHARKVLGC